MERKLIPDFIEELTNIDYWGLQIPTYESAFSTTPRWRNNKDDQFICTAVFKKEYVDFINQNGGTLSRCSENMLPAFFVYESDELSINEQFRICKEITNDPLVKNWIFSQTFSGSKSIHTLVWIDPKFRQDVSRDFKYYWGVVGERIFGKNTVGMLDPQCASIGRLSRNPNGIRSKDDNTKIKQTCFFYNPESIENFINLENWISDHNKVLDKLEIQMQVDFMERMKNYANNVDEKKKLEGIYNKGKCSESFKVAYNVLVNGLCPQGANYVSAASSLFGCGFSKDIIREMLEKASTAHPTNISSRRVEQIINKF